MELQVSPSLNGTHPIQVHLSKSRFRARSAIRIKSPPIMGLPGQPVLDLTNERDNRIAYP